MSTDENGLQLHQGSNELALIQDVGELVQQRVSATGQIKSTMAPFIETKDILNRTARHWYETDHTYLVAFLRAIREEIDRVREQDVDLEDDFNVLYEGGISPGLTERIKNMAEYSHQEQFWLALMQQENQNFPHFYHHLPYIRKYIFDFVAPDWPKAMIYLSTLKMDWISQKDSLMELKYERILDGLNQLLSEVRELLDTYEQLKRLKNEE